MNKTERKQSVLGQARAELTNHFPRSNDSHGDCLFYAKNKKILTSSYQTF